LDIGQSPQQKPTETVDWMISDTANIIAPGGLNV
jgi:hypothetical protein